MALTNLAQGKDSVSGTTSCIIQKSSHIAEIKTVKVPLVQKYQPRCHPPTSLCKHTALLDTSRGLLLTKKRSLCGKVSVKHKGNSHSFRLLSVSKNAKEALTFNFFAGLKFYYSISYIEMFCNIKLFLNQSFFLFSFSCIFSCIFLIMFILPKCLCY